MDTLIGYMEFIVGGVIMLFALKAFFAREE
jgi:hypothetical protein